MALHNKKLTITSDTIVNDKKIVTFGAVMDIETGKLKLFEQRGDAVAIKENRNIVRADREEFEDFAYSVQDDVKGMLGLTDEEIEEPVEEDA